MGILKCKQIGRDKDILEKALSRVGSSGLRFFGPQGNMAERPTNSLHLERIPLKVSKVSKRMITISTDFTNGRSL
jgi:uncharacterized protein (DUF111 family)